MRSCFTCFAVAIFAGSSFSAVAQPVYPAKSVRVVIPYPPGGGNDIIGRIVADDLGRRLGQQMLVDNRPGGSTSIGAEIVARAPADGYTLLITSHTTYALLPNLRPKLNYDPIRDFEPVSLLAKQSFALAVHPSLPATTVKQVITLAKARPGQMTFSSAGAGTGTHFSGEQFKTLAGLDILHVPYKGGNTAVNAVLSGETTMTFGSLSALSPYVNAKKLRVIAVTSGKRSPLDTKIPTIAESGLPGYQFDSWFGFLGPAAIPAAEANRINAAVSKLLKDPVVLARLDKQGIEPRDMSNADFSKLLAADYVRMAQVVKASGAKID